MTYNDVSDIFVTFDHSKNKRADKLLFELLLARKAINKQVPRMPDNLNEDTWSCPRCGKQYETEEENNYYYCPNCGQAIDWSMYEEDE